MLNVGRSLLQARKRSAAWLNLLVFFDRLRNSDGVAAVEFAFVAPVLILLYVGAAELSQAVMTSRKVTLLSRTLTDLTAQQPTSFQATSTPAPSNAIAQATLQNIFTASTAIMAPSPVTSLGMTVTAIDVVNKSSGLCCNFMVRWSYTQSGTLRPCNTPMTLVSPTQAPSATTLPSSLMPPVASLTMPLSILVSDVGFVYSGPFATSWINFGSGMNQTTYSLPRNTGQVIVSAPLTPSGNQSGTICY